MCCSRLIRTLAIIISLFLFTLDIIATNDLFSSYYTRRNPLQSYFDRLESKLPKNLQPISYKLDVWSQYDSPEEGKAREGDIIDCPVSRKTLTADRKLLWPKGIVRYFLHASIVRAPAQWAILRDAMKTIQDVTCVKFIRIYVDENGKYPSHKWVNITGVHRGCFSDLGVSSASHNVLNLNLDKCFRTKGHAIHEILHTLGVFHEHMRPDRDEYIEIFWDNIKKGDQFNFLMMDQSRVATYGVPYDYDSIMHYSMTAFSKDRSLPTIIPRAEGVVIGQRNHLSFGDIQKLLIAYKCKNIYEDYIHRAVGQNASSHIEFFNLNATKVTPDENQAETVASQSDYY